MKKNKTKSKKESRPSSLFHYTSLESLTCILPSKESHIINGIPFMDFRFSCPCQCNDKMELRFFTESLYRESEVSRQLQKEVEQEGKQIGTPFIFSLIRHKRKEISNCPLTEIPMWNMYGDNSKGVRLRLNYELLKKYCDKEDICLFPCIYYTTTQMQQYTATIRSDMKDNIKEEQRIEICAKIFKEAVKYKTINWNYEYEHRRVIWSRDFERIGDNKYYHIKIPFECLKDVQVGPLANYEDTKEKIELIQNSISKLGIKHSFDIKPSKILIR